MARILQLTDLHVVAPGTTVSRVLDTPALLRDAIDRLVARLDAIGPIDAVLVTGDVSDDGSNESYAMARAELSRLGVPVFAVPGNHDRREGLRACFAETPWMPREGLIDWIAELPDCLLAGLDTLVEGRGGGRLRAESLELLRSAVRAAGQRPLIVALHHSPLKTGIRFMDAIGLENPDDLAVALAGARGPVRLLAGHVHGIYQGQINGCPVVTGPAVCSAFALDRRPEAPAGFMTGPRGCALLDTEQDCVWTALPFGPADGPFPFRPGEDHG